MGWKPGGSFGVVPLLSKLWMGRTTGCELLKAMRNSATPGSRGTGYVILSGGNLGLVLAIWVWCWPIHEYVSSANSVRIMT
jgi:hypothetical protein